MAGSSTHSWFAVSDARDGGDLLSRINPDDADPESNEISVGDTGTSNIEAIALQPGTGVLFAADAGRLGILDTDTGRFEALGARIGTGSGPDGDVTFNDVDGLAFDARTGFLYGMQRRGGRPDLLLRIDPATGARVAGALGEGHDYVVVAPTGDLNDIGDLAVQPEDGRVFAIANRYTKPGDRLVQIDVESGRTTDVGPVGVDDIQGLCVAPEGTLHGTTGGASPEGEAVWDIDSATGAATNPRPLDNGRDYEGLACGTAAQPADSRPEEGGPGAGTPDGTPPEAVPPVASPAPAPPGVRVPAGGPAPAGAPLPGGDDSSRGSAAAGPLPGTQPGSALGGELPRTGRPAAGGPLTFLAGLALLLGGGGVMAGASASARRESSGR